MLEPKSSDAFKLAVISARPSTGIKSAGPDQVKEAESSDFAYFIYNIIF